MRNLYSVVYDLSSGQPFAIVRGDIAHALGKASIGWAARYNGGEKSIPAGMALSNAVDMGEEFEASFKSAFARADRTSRRASMLASSGTEWEPSEILYGAGNGPSPRRRNGMDRKVMPVISHLQREQFRSRLIGESIRTGKRWKKRNA